MGRVECVTTGWRDLFDALGGSDVVFVAPSSLKARAVRKSVSDLIASIYPVTLDGLVDEIVDSAVPGIRRIGRTATEYVVASILRDYREALSYLPDVQVFPGIATVVARFISATINAVPEVVHSGFEAAIDSANASPRDKDLILVGDEFLDRLRKRGAACDDVLLVLALEALDSGDSARVQKLSEQQLVIDRVYRSSELQWRVLGALANRAKHTYVLGHALADRFEGIASIEAIRSRLSDLKIKEVLVETVGERAVHVFETREAEVQAVAQQIFALLYDNPSLRASDIAVVVPNLDRYLPIIDECLPAYGIAFEAVNGFPLRTNPMACVVSRLLAQIRSPGDRAGLFELLASGSVDAGGIDIQLVDSYARRFNLSDLSNLAHELNSMPENYLPEGDGLERLRESVERLDGLLGSLRDFTQQCKPQKFVDQLLDLLANLQVVTNGIVALSDFNRRSDEHSEWVIGEWSRRNASALAALVDVLMDIRDTILLFDEAGTVSRDDLIQTVEDAVDGRRYRCEPTVDAVLVMGYQEARGAEFRHCFLLGLVEGEFPTPQQRSFVLEGGGEWRERCFDAAHLLLDVLDGNSDVFLTAFASENSSVVGISPVLDGVKQERVAALADLSDDSAPGYTRPHAQAAAGLAFTAGETDQLLRLLEPGDVSRAVRQLRMEVCREIQPFGGPYGGEVSPGVFDLDVRHYSVTQLETYVRCPFRYMARYLLDIRPIEEVEDELLSNEMGSFIHQILCRFGDEGGFALMRSDPEKARKLLLEIARAVFNLTAEGKRLSMFMKVQFERLVDGLDGNSEGYGLLRRFFDYELSRGSATEPRLLEKEFNLVVPLAFEDERSARGRGMRIVGLIDRVDVSDDGSVCFVMDYKTGRPPSTLRIKEGLSFQLPVYLLALRDSGIAAENCQLIAGYYHLPVSGQIKISSLFGDVEATLEVVGRKPTNWDLPLSDIGGIDGLVESIQNIRSDMDSGAFVTTRLKADQAGCRYCEYSRICRHEQSSEAGFQSAVSDGGEH